MQSDKLSLTDKETCLSWKAFVMFVIYSVIHMKSDRNSCVKTEKKNLLLA